MEQNGKILASFGLYHTGIKKMRKQTNFQKKKTVVIFVEIPFLAKVCLYIYTYMKYKDDIRIVIYVWLGLFIYIYINE